MLKKVVFLDRDGVINHDSLSYIKKLEEFIFIPGSLPAICKLHGSGFSVFIITNQSGIARNLVTPLDLDKIHHYIISSVDQAGGHIHGIYFCPHHPEQGCNCRKPQPGLIHRAARDHHIDIASSIMVGDKYSDMECAHNAGCMCAYMVMTGIEKKPTINIKDLNQTYYRYAKTLFHAVDIIIAENEP